MSAAVKAVALPLEGSACAVWFQRKIRAGTVIAVARVAAAAGFPRVTVRFAVAKGKEVTRTLSWEPARDFIAPHTQAFAFTDQPVTVPAPADDRELRELSRCCGAEPDGQGLRRCSECRERATFVLVTADGVAIT